MQRVLAYIVILIVAIVGLMWAYNTFIRANPLDQSQTLQELGLQDTGNEFVKIERPTYQQTIVSPLTVRLWLADAPQEVMIRVVSEEGVVLGTQTLSSSARANQMYTTNVEFSSFDGQGYLEVQFAGEGKAGVRLPVTL